MLNDENLNLKKVIHSYLFHIEDRSKIKINWEHQQIKWIKPAGIDNYETMSKLKETLAQVLSGQNEDDNKIKTE